MPAFDDLTSALPARRDDEPPQLRGEIAKELRDHLQCAVQRELVLTGNEEEATQRALARFGDPTRIARQLWFDALWEKIMSQRILVGLCAIMTVACLSMGVFNWRASAESADVVRKLIEQSDAANRQLVEQSRSMNQLMLDQSRESNRALLEKMGGFVATGSAVPSPEWVSVKIRLVLDTLEEAPAAGYTVFVSNTLPGSTEQRSEHRILLSEKSNNVGVLDCGKLRSGNYWLEVTTPWDETCHTDFFVRAGVAEHIETIVCPSAELPRNDVMLELDVPDDLRDKPLGLLCEFRQDERMLDDKQWTQLSVENTRTKIVPMAGVVWSTSQIHYLPQHSPPIVRVFDVTRADMFRWTGGKHGLRVRGIVLLSNDHPPYHGEYLQWIHGGDPERGINSELTTDASTPNHLKIPIPPHLVEKVRTALRQDADARKAAEEKPSG